MSNFLGPHDCSLPNSFVQEFSRQEYWNGLPFPPPEDLPYPGIELTSMAPALAGGFFTTEQQGYLFIDRATVNLILILRFFFFPSLSH